MKKKDNMFTSPITFDDMKKEWININPNLKESYELDDIYVKMLIPILKKRHELGLSQRDLAKMCELPQSTIARIETMDNKASITTLIKIINALGLTITIQ